MKKILRYEPGDNVAVALEELAAGDQVELDGLSGKLRVVERIPAGHKLAAEDIAKGEAVRKFSHVIGYAKEAIPAGAHVHVHNVEDSVGRWGEAPHTYDPSTVKEIADAYRLEQPPVLYGYRRPNGLVGFRNHLLVISTVVCANQPVEELGKRYPDIITLPNPTGCVILPNEVARLKALLLGLARNPNVGAVLFCGLGCEAVDAQWYWEQMRGEKPVEFVRIQTEGSCEKALDKLEKLALSMKARLDKEPREEVGLSAIRLGTKCGGSDWTTAAVSNPAIGFVSDVVVKNGGISIQGETTGWFGGEDYFLRHARNEQVAARLLALMEETYQRALQVGRRIEEGNPTPGNMEGGITTLAEKALGNVKKGGTAPVEGILEIGEYPQAGSGLYLANNPGLDPISLLGLTSSGANVLIYSTGRGSPVGTPIAPSIKLTASPTSMHIFSAHIDVEITDVTRGDTPLDKGAWRLFDALIDTCNGALTVAEQKGHREFAFPLLMSPL